MKHVIKSRAIERNRAYKTHASTADGLFAIYWCEEARVWIPMVELKDVRKHLGTFDTLREASNAQISAYYDLVDEGVIKKVPRKVWANQPYMSKPNSLEIFLRGKGVDADVFEGVFSEYLPKYRCYQYSAYIPTEAGYKVVSTHLDAGEAKESYNYYMKNLHPLIADIG